MANSAFDSLPKPGAADHKWQQAYAKFAATGDVAGYTAYLKSRGVNIPAAGTTGPSAGTSGPAGASGPSTAGVVLPPPPANAGDKWQKAYAQYQANPTAGYGAYYQFLQGGTQGQALLAAGHYPAPGTAGAPGAGPVGGASGPGVGTDPGLTPPGTTTLKYDDPNTLGLYNRDPNWLANFVTPGTATAGTTGTVTPTPTPTPVPGASGTTGAGQGNGQGSSGSGTNGTGGNAGGTDHGVGGGGAGDNAGHPGAGAGTGGNSPGAAAVAGHGGLLDDNSLINLGPLGAGLLSGASMLAPGWAGVGLGVAQAGLRGVNVSIVDQIRAQQGLPPLDAGQIAGGVSALNQYGNLGGGNTIANPDQLANRLGQVPAYNLANSAMGGMGAPAETQGGSTYQEGPGGVLGWAARALGLVDDTPHRALDVASVNRLTNPNFDDSAWPSTGGNPDSDMPAAGAPPGRHALLAMGFTEGQIADGSALRAVSNPGGIVSKGTGSGGAGASDRSGQSMGNTSNASGLGNPGGAGIGGVSGHDTTAVGASGQLGHIATGGFIGDHIDPSANPLMDTGGMEQRLVMAALTEKFGPEVAQQVMSRLPMPGRKPPQPLPDATTGDVPTMTGVEGGWPLRTNPGNLRVNISGSGHSAPVAHRQLAAAGPTETDLLNWAQVAKHGGRVPPEIARALAQRIGTSLPQGAIPAMATGGMVTQPVNRLTGGAIPGDPAQGDTVPIRATPREFMINQQSADNLGPNLLNALNNPQVAKWLGDQMDGFSKATPDATTGTVDGPAPGAMGGQPQSHGDPHLPDGFIDAIMHDRHKANLEALLSGGWKRNWV